MEDSVDNLQDTAKRETATRETAARLEWANYAQVAYFARAVPGVAVSISSEMVQVTSQQIPMMDVNHTAMLRVPAECAGERIREITAHYRDLGIQPCIALSPACAPADLEQRLEAQGYEKFGGPEYWLKLVDTSVVEKLKDPPGITVRQIGREDLPTFCQVMAAAFEMPAEMAPMLQQGFEHTCDLPGVRSYVAYAGGQPVGCVSMNTYQGYTAVGSGGVLPDARRLGTSYALWKRTYEDWRKIDGGEYIMQTAIPMLEKVLRMGGCKRLFTRTYYVLP